MEKQEAITFLQRAKPKDNNAMSIYLREAIDVATEALEHQIEVDKVGLIQSHRKCVLGKDTMYSDNTLRSMSKEDLIHLLHVAQHNYAVLLESHDARIRYYEKENMRLTEELEEQKTPPIMIRRV